MLRGGPHWVQTGRFRTVWHSFARLRPVSFRAKPSLGLETKRGYTPPFRFVSFVRLDGFATFLILAAIVYT